MDYAEIVTVSPLTKYLDSILEDENYHYEQPFGGDITKEFSSSFC